MWGRWEAAGGPSKGSLAPFHSSIVRSPCLPCAPRGLRQHVLPNPASLHSSLSNVTGWEDVYVFQDFGRRGWGCAERERGDRDGAKGEGVPGRALTVAPASSGRAFDGKELITFKESLFIGFIKLMICGRSLLKPTQALFTFNLDSKVLNHAKYFLKSYK